MKRPAHAWNPWHEFPPLDHEVLAHHAGEPPRVVIRERRLHHWQWKVVATGELFAPQYFTHWQHLPAEPT